MMIRGTVVTWRTEMARKILESCPSCGGRLEITEVRCTQCETHVQARYRPCDFCGLSDEQSTFLRLFVTSRGNLSEVEKRLGVSYPTVRAKLDEVIGQLAVPAGGQGPGARGQGEDPIPGPRLPTPEAGDRRLVLEAV